MNICFISYHTCPLSDEKKPDIGGMNTYVFELANALSQKGYYIDIYTRCTDKNCSTVVQVNPFLRIIHLAAGEKVGIPTKKLVKYIPEFTANLIRFIKQEKLSYQLISSHYFLSGLIGLRLKNEIKSPLTVTFHTLALMKNLVARTEMEREDLPRIKAEMELVKKSDQIIATSINDLEYIHSLYNCPLEKIALLSPGVNLQSFYPIDKQKAKKITQADINNKIILFVGRIASLKGIDVLLYAIKILVQRNPKLKINLWIVGENICNGIKPSSEFIRLKSIVKLLRLESFVKFIGQKKGNQLIYYYNSSELVVMPSWYESFGIVALEAMACAVPVISSDVTGVSGLLDEEHNHLITSANNPINLASKIEYLLINKNKYLETSKEVKKRVQNLGWNKVAEKFIQVITESRSLK